MLTDTSRRRILIIGALGKLLKTLERLECLETQTIIEDLDDLPKLPRGMTKMTLCDHVELLRRIIELETKRKDREDFLGVN